MQPRCSVLRISRVRVELRFSRERETSGLDFGDDPRLGEISSLGAVVGIGSGRGAVIFDTENAALPVARK